jgi:hypothetical protein
VFGVIGGLWAERYFSIGQKIKAAVPFDAQITKKVDWPICRLFGYVFVEFRRRSSPCRGDINYWYCGASRQVIKRQVPGKEIETLDSWPKGQADARDVAVQQQSRHLLDPRDPFHSENFETTAGPH